MISSILAAIAGRLNQYIYTGNGLLLILSVRVVPVPSPLLLFDGLIVVLFGCFVRLIYLVFFCLAADLVVFPGNLFG